MAINFISERLVIISWKSSTVYCSRISQAYISRLLIYSSFTSAFNNEHLIKFHSFIISILTTSFINLNQISTLFKTIYRINYDQLDDANFESSRCVCPFLSRRVPSSNFSYYVEFFTITLSTNAPDFIRF